MEPVIAPETMARYRRTAHTRDLTQRQDTDRRRQAAWLVARQAARLLKETFGATRVIAFGSLAHGAWFSLHSDVDLAVEGVPPMAYWRAWAALDRIDPAFKIDLVAIESAPEHLRAEIAEQGVIL